MTAIEPQTSIDTGDSVKHGPTGETWVVAYVKGNRLAWVGWPPGEALLSDCTLVEKATPQARDNLLRQLASKVDRDDGAGDARRSYARARLGLIAKNPPTLAEVQVMTALRRDRWHDGGSREWSVLEWAGAMCGEAGEAANVAKKLLRIELGLRGNEVSEHIETDREQLRAKLAGEIGGVVIYAALLASSAGIDFEDAVVRTFNDKSRALGFPERL